MIYTVERTPVLLPLFDAPRLVLRADLLSADQDAFARPQVRGVDARIVPDDGLHGNLVLPRNGVERLALRDEVEIERLAEFALRLAVLLRGDLRHDGNADVRGALQPLGQRRIVLHDDLLAHAVEFRQPVERLARLHGVDVILRPVDIDDRPGLFAGRQGAEAPSGPVNFFFFFLFLLLQFPPAGHPTHFTPLLFALIRYAAALPTKITITRTAIIFSIEHFTSFSNKNGGQSTSSLSTVCYNFYPL